MKLFTGLTHNYIVNRSLLYVLLTIQKTKCMASKRKFLFQSNIAKQSKKQKKSEVENESEFSEYSEQTKKINYKNYFKYDKFNEEPSALCLNCNVRIPRKNGNTSGLVKHLQRFHDKIYKDLFPSESTLNNQKTLDSFVEV